MGKISALAGAVLFGLTTFVAAQNVDIAAWYGKNTYFYSNTLLDVSSFLNSSGTTLGGSSFGIDFWLGNKLQYGIGAAYIPEFASNFSSSFAILFITINTNVQSQLDLIPMMFQVRYFPVPRWFFGGGAGVFGYHAVVQGSASAWFVPLVGASVSQQNYTFG